MTLLDDIDETACRVCGCTDNHACDGGCCWVPDPLALGELCSACAIRPCVGGLDLSIAATGVAHWADRRVETWKTVRPGDERLVEIADHLANYFSDHARPDLIVIEDVPVHAHAAGITAMVHGLTRWLLLDEHHPYVLVPPATLKTYATGKGNATKPDMRMELYKRTDLDLKDDNQVDAWWLRALGLDLLGEPLLELPKDHRRALDKIQLPAGVS
jgi:Holliday junction resolvasome RuvABC endonuclease subunit